MSTLANCRVSFVACLCVCGFALGDDHPREETSKLVSEPASVARERTGIIDMAFLFKNYARFVDERDALAKQIHDSDVTAKVMAKEIKELDDSLQQATKGATVYMDLQAELARRKVEFEIFRSQTKADFLKREAQIYKEVYLEVKKAVANHADKNGYTLVIRFSRENVEEKTDPEEIVSSLNKQIIYFQPQHDITDEVLKQLNDAYQKNAASKKKPDV